jgi:polyhydroxybutyrate depolymerase
MVQLVSGLQCSVALLCIFTASGLNIGGFTNITITSGGLSRKATIYVPKLSVLQVKAPLIVDNHGWGCTIENQISKSRFNEFADKEGFVVVWPSGYYRATQPLWPAWLPLPPLPVYSWAHGYVTNAGTCCPQAAAKEVDDVGFVVDLIQLIKEELRNATESDREIDSQRIYTTGLSGGAMFANRLGCELTDVFAAIAPVSGPILDGKVTGVLPATLSGSDPYRCSGVMPTLYFHGTADIAVPFKVEFFHRLFLGFPGISYYKAQRKKLNGIPRSDKGTITYKYGNATCTSFGASEKNTTFCDMQNGAHSWPGTPNGHASGIFRTDYTSIDASTYMLDFFRQHSKKPSVCGDLRLNADMDGDNIARFKRLGSHGECCVKCQMNNDCKAFAYAIRNGGLFSGISKGDCWLKGAIGSTKHKPGIAVGMKPSQTISLEEIMV